MKKISFLNAAAMLISIFMIAAVLGCWVRGIIYYVNQNIGKAIFWMIAGVAVDTCCTWIIGAIQATGSKIFADFVQGPDKNNEQ